MCRRRLQIPNRFIMINAAELNLRFDIMNGEEMNHGKNPDDILQKFFFGKPRKSVGYVLNLMGFVFLVGGVMNWMFALILLGVVFLAAGIGCSVLAERISERKANKQ